MRTTPTVSAASVLAIVLAALAPIAAQEKPAPPSFDDIVACVKAATCRNAESGKLHWQDVINIPVMTLKDGEAGYAMHVTRLGALEIFVTLPGDRLPSRLVGVGPGEQVVSGELGPLPGEFANLLRMTAAEMATWSKNHKVFSAPGRLPPNAPRSDEFKTFWEEQARLALAAIRRAIAK